MNKIFAFFLQISFSFFLQQRWSVSTESFTQSSRSSFSFNLTAQSPATRMHQCKKCHQHFHTAHGLNTHTGRKHGGSDSEPESSQGEFHDNGPDPDCEEDILERENTLRDQMMDPAEYWEPFKTQKDLETAQWLKQSGTTRSAQDKLAKIMEQPDTIPTAKTLSRRIQRISELYPKLDSGHFRILTLGKTINELVKAYGAALPA
jgi:hypothetical protein